MAQKQRIIKKIKEVDSNCVPSGRRAKCECFPGYARRYIAGFIFFFEQKSALNKDSTAHLIVNCIKLLNIQVLENQSLQPVIIKKSRAFQFGFQYFFVIKG